MSSNEFRGKYEAVKKDPLKPWYPVIGLVLLAIAAAVGVLASGSAYTLLQSYMPQLEARVCPIPEIHQCQMQMIVAGGIALVIIGIFSTVFALLAPRPKHRKLVAENTLKAQKEQMNQERIRAKRRKAQMRQKMKKANRQK